MHMAPATVQHEVKSLTEAGILERRAEGRQVYYRANLDCPIFPELHGLMLKTAGLPDLLARALVPLADDMEFAFVFGAIAEGRSLSESDVDLMVIGKVGLRRLAPALQEAAGILGREINPVTLSSKEFAKRIRSKDHFLMTVLSRPVIMVLGDRDDLEEFA